MIRHEMCLKWRDSNEGSTLEAIWHFRFSGSLHVYGAHVEYETRTIFMFKYCKVVQRVFICFGLIFFSENRRAAKKYGSLFD